MGVTGPSAPTTSTSSFSEPRRGVYKSVVVRDGRLIGATLVGDVSKVAFLMQAFDRGLPLPEERISLLFDLGAPPAEVGVAELADDAQVCNCNGVSKGDASRRACAAACNTVAGVMDATRAGKGCGSCKTLVAQVVEWAADGDLEEDASASWYVPGVPYAKPELVALDPRARPALGVRGVRRAGARRGRGRAVARWG